MDLKTTHTNNREENYTSFLNNPIETLTSHAHQTDGDPCDEHNVLTHDEAKSTSSPGHLELLHEYTYRSPHMLGELILCVSIAILGATLPELLPLHKVPIPYYITESGDVILDFELNKEHVEKETITEITLMILCVVLPLLFFILMGVVLGPKYDGHASICSYSIAVGTTLFLTEIFKHYVGRLRPNFYEYCGFDVHTLECTSDSDEPRKSFPSGHSSLSFSSMTILSLFFLGKVGIYKGLGKVGNSQSSHDQTGITPSFEKKVLCYISLTPIVLAMFIAASRVYDNYHHPSDVIAGSLIGFSCAIFSHSLWYPPIYSQLAGIPLQTLGDGESNPEEFEFKPLVTHDPVPV